jgi:lactoylglutathione lyase
LISGLFHSSYTVSDAEKSAGFCSQVLGLEHTRWQVSDQPYLQSVTGIPGCSLRIGFARAEGDETSFEMVEYVYPKGSRANTGFGIPGSMNMSWEVDNMDATLDRLNSAKVRLEVEPKIIESGLWQGALEAFFLDLDGICTGLVEINHQPDGMGRLLRLHHTTFTVTSINAALGIFCGKLGLEIDSGTQGADGNTSPLARPADVCVRKAYLSIPNSRHKMELLEFSTPIGPVADMATNNLGSGHLCFQVDNIHNTFNELRSVGVEFVGLPTEVTAGVNKGGFATYFKGVDGIRFELFQKPKPVA